MTFPVLGGVLLVCLGLLLGAAWSIQVFQSKVRRQAEERRRLNEEWSAVRTARHQRATCPHCEHPLPEQDWYYASTIVPERPDD